MTKEPQLLQPASTEKADWALCMSIHSRIMYLAKCPSFGKKQFRIFADLLRFVETAQDTEGFLQRYKSYFIDKYFMIKSPPTGCYVQTFSSVYNFIEGLKEQFQNVSYVYNLIDIVCNSLNSDDVKSRLKLLRDRDITQDEFEVLQKLVTESGVNMLQLVVAEGINLNGSSNPIPDHDMSTFILGPELKSSQVQDQIIDRLSSTQEQIFLQNELLIYNVNRIINANQHLPNMSCISIVVNRFKYEIQKFLEPFIKITEIARAAEFKGASAGPWVYYGDDSSEVVPPNEFLGAGAAYQGDATAAAPTGSRSYASGVYSPQFPPPLPPLATGAGYYRGAAAAAPPIERGQPAYGFGMQSGASVSSSYASIYNEPPFAQALPPASSSYASGVYSPQFPPPLPPLATATGVGYYRGAAATGMASAGAQVQGQKRKEGPAGGEESASKRNPASKDPDSAALKDKIRSKLRAVNSGGQSQDSSPAITPAITPATTPATTPAQPESSGVKGPPEKSK